MLFMYVHTTEVNEILKFSKFQKIFSVQTRSNIWQFSCKRFWVPYSGTSDAGHFSALPLNDNTLEMGGR
jgi:hypothetical protein